MTDVNFLVISQTVRNGDGNYSAARVGVCRDYCRRLGERWVGVDREAKNEKGLKGQV